MTRAEVAFVLALTACGGGTHATTPSVDANACADAAVCDGKCAALFTGNFTDSSLDAANCAQLTPQLTLNAQSTVIGSPLAISIDLGDAPMAGMFSSETVATWTAVQARSIDDGGCVYSAGNDIVPIGSFTLDLASVAGSAAHGTLDLALYVHALEATDCGAASIEDVEVIF